MLKFILLVMREVFDYALTQLYNMGKRSSSSELKSSQLPLSIHKYSVSELKQSSATHWEINDIQPYFPSIEKLFKCSDLTSLTDYGIKFTDEIQIILSKTAIRTINGSTVDVHNKVTMLLSPYKWMRGEYGKTLGLPTSIEQATTSMHKIQDTNNAAYVGALISSVLSQSGCHHFPKVYGVFSGNSMNHTIDISDDYDELSDRPWFSNNIGKMFDIKLSDEVQDKQEFRHTRKSRIAITLGDQVDLGVIPELETSRLDDVQMADLNKLLNEDDECVDDSSDSSSVSTSYIFGVNSCDSDVDEEDDSDDESYEPFAWATFKEVPVQITVMEKCEGTLYQLLMLNPETEKHIAWIAQVMFALAYAQRNFGLTHNDLHANNVMYNQTKEEYFYYNCGGVLYKVPTYGYLIKIIDFERGIASIKLTGMKEPKLFVSDHFCEEEEAGGQYNFACYYNSKSPEIKPSASFDLVRIATSLYWDLFPEPEPDNLLFKLFTKWLTLEDGTSILFGKKQPKHDRFHGFNLYKAIARYCKDNAVPRKEIESLRSLFQTESIPTGSVSLFIDC